MIKPSRKRPKLKTYIDLFCGIGGFHIAASRLGMRCVFASDIDEHAKIAYEHNYGIAPHGDITLLDEVDIPDHDVLFAGFPCQPFSIAGQGKGLQDTRGTLFFDIVRIAKEKKPKVLVLENVKRLVTIDDGKTFALIVKTLEDMDYCVDWKVMNALNYGLPQKRERVIVVAHQGLDFEWPAPVEMPSLSTILDASPDEKHFVSAIIRKQMNKHKPIVTPSIWHTNKSGNISSHPFSCALRANASYNYLLVNGKRRLTPREMLRLQGFPDQFEIVCSDCQTRKQAGNSVPIPMIESVLSEIQNAAKK